MNLKLLSSIAFACAASLPAMASTHVSVGLQIGVPPPVIIHRAPPPRVAETVVVSPGAGFAWVAGHYTWANNQWVWVPGAWVMPPQPGAAWVDGRWDQAAQAWTEGHWEIATVATPGPAGAIIINTAPPPPRHEIRGRRPGREYVWISGYWGFEHGRHYWVPGRWERPPHGRHGWVESRWQRRGGSYVLIQGHWD